MDSLTRTQDAIARRRRRVQDNRASDRTVERLEPRLLLSGNVTSPIDVSSSASYPFGSVYAPGTPIEYVQEREAFARQFRIPRYEFSDAARWSSTITSGGGLQQGDPTTLTWSIVPDGTPVDGFNGEAAAPSNFVAFMDGIYGTSGGALSGRPWFNMMVEIFDSWANQTGLTFIYEPNDDGAALDQTFPDGRVGVRGDMRISGHPLDGNFGTLAYNFFPGIGEMVVDTGDSFYNDTSNNSVGLRSTFAHEIGHGLGFSHVCPNNGTKLMEPFNSGNFPDPQHDDLLAAHRGYGDYREHNDTAATASNLGLLQNGTHQIRNVSIDSNTDVDYFRFTLSEDKQISLTLSPIGQTYLSGSQNGDGSCSAGTTFNSQNQNNLSIQVIDIDGTTVLATANQAGLGLDETLNQVLLPDPGTYYLRVVGSQDKVQLYSLDFTLEDAQTIDPNVVINADTLANNGTLDHFVLSQSGSRTRVALNGTSIFDAPSNEIDTITINGSQDSDRLTIDFATGNPIPGGGVQFAGSGPGAVGNSIELINSSFANVNYEVITYNTGTVSLDGRAMAFSGVSAIEDELSSLNRRFTYLSGTDNVELSDDFHPSNGISQIARMTAGPSITFQNPSSLITVDAGSLDDQVTLTPLESSYTTFGGRIAVVTGDGADAVSIGTGAVLNPVGGYRVDTNDELNGTGAVLTSVFVEDGGAIRPGDDVGTLSVNGVTFAGSGARLDMDIDGPLAGSQHDQLIVNGIVTLNNATLDLDLTFMPTFSDTITLLNNDGFDAISGTFNGLPEGAVFTSNGNVLAITYRGGDGNDIVLTRSAPNTAFVDDSWSAVPIGTDPDGSGPALAMGLDAFSTITDALDSVLDGGIIQVHAGFYDSDFAIDKSVTLRGPNAGIHAAVGTDTSIVAGTRGMEAVMTGSGSTGLEIRADNVTIDGFTFTGDIGRQVWAIRSVVSATIQNNVFEFSGRTSSEALIRLGSGSYAGWTVRFNNFADAAGKIIDFADGGSHTGLVIARNAINGPGPLIAAQTAQFDSAAIEYNIFDGDFAGTPRQAVAVTLPDTSNTTIQSNLFANLATGIHAGVVNGDINANTFTGSLTAIELLADSVGAGGSRDVSIQHNLFEFNQFAGVSSQAIHVMNGTEQIDGDRILIHQNVFVDGDAQTNVSAIRHDGDPATIVNASTNYWGTTDPAELSALVGANVDFTPYLPNDTDISPADPGFQASLGELYVTAVSPQADVLSRIQEGIELLDDAGTLRVVAGTYDEQVDVNKALTLVGANAGVHPAVGFGHSQVAGVRQAETILAPAVSGGMTISSADVTIDGFTFTGSHGRNISSNVDAPRLTIRNSIFDHDARASNDPVIEFTDGIHDATTFEYNLVRDRGSRTIEVRGISFEDLLVSRNEFEVAGEGMWGNQSPLRDAVIRQNTFAGGGVGFNIGRAGNVTIEHNHFHDLAVGMQVGFSDGRIIGNTFDHNHVAFEIWGGEAGTTISSVGQISNNRITINDVADERTDGLRLRSGVNTALIDIHDNAFDRGTLRSDGRAIVNDTLSTRLVDASNNWWGTADALGTAAVVDSSIDYTPWLGSGVDLDPVVPGFQADRSVLHVDDDSPQSGPLGRIQEGIAGAGERLNLEAGTYVENVRINRRGLTIVGAQETVPAFQLGPDGSFVPRSGDETIIQAGAGDAITVLTGNAADIAIRGLRIEGTANPNTGVDHGIVISGDLTNVELANNMLVDLNDHAIFATNAGSRLGLAIEGNAVDSWQSTAMTTNDGKVGIYVDAADNDQIFVRDNFVRGAQRSSDAEIGSRGIVLEDTSNSVVSGNAVRAVFESAIELTGSGDLVSLTDNDLQSVGQAVTLDAGVSGLSAVEVNDNRITDVFRRAIYLTGSGSFDDVSIESNQIQQDVSQLFATHSVIDVQPNVTATPGFISITGNQMTFDGAFLHATSFHGVGIGGGIGQLDISNNVLDGGDIVSGVASVPVAGVVLWTNDRANGSIPATASIDMTGNVVDGFETAVVAFDSVNGVFGGLVPGVDVQVHHNRLLPTTGFGINNGGLNASEAIDASLNWWGLSNGTIIPSLFIANVDYSPWLNHGIDSDNAADGFQGDTATLNVGLTDQIGSQGIIAEGLDSLTGDQLVVWPGVYRENVTLASANDGLTLRGGTANAADVTINGGSDAGVLVGADDVELRHLTIQGGTAALVRQSGPRIDQLALNNIRLLNSASAFDLSSVQALTLTSVSASGNVSGGMIGDVGSLTLNVVTSAGVSVGGSGLFQAGTGIQDPVDVSTVDLLNVIGDAGDNNFSVALTDQLPASVTVDGMAESSTDSLDILGSSDADMFTVTAVGASDGIHPVQSVSIESFAAFGLGGDDLFVVETIDFIPIDGGQGYDTLKLDPVISSFDLTLRNIGSIRNIEELDLQDNVAQTLVLNLSIVQGMTDSNNTLIVQHDDIDDVVDNIGAGWTELALTQIGDQLYRTFSQSGVTLLAPSFGTTIRGQKFEDLNGNAVVEPGEVPLNGWTMELVNTADGQVVATAQTGDVDLDGDGSIDPLLESGVYEFPDLLPGRYVVREVSRVGWIQTIPADGTYFVDVSTSPGTVIADFGNQPIAASVSGTVWHDLNGDGVRDVNDVGVDGWPVFLDVNRNGEHDLTTSSFTSTDVPATIPSIQTTLSTLSISSLNDLLVSDVDINLTIEHGFVADLDVYLISPQGTRVELFTDVGRGTANLTNTTLDDSASSNIRDGVGPFTGSFQPEGSLADFRNETVNGTWTLEITDDGFGFTGTLIDWSLEIGAIEPLTLTQADDPATPEDEAGEYVLDGVSANREHHIRSATRNGWRQTLPLTASQLVSVPAGDTLTDIDFAHQAISIRGIKWDDLNGNGTRDQGEPGLEGWSFYLDLNSNDTHDTNEPLALSNANGEFAFTGLLAGDYVVREIGRAGWVQTAPVGSGEALAPVTVTQIAPVVEFGNFARFDIAGSLFDDLNADGVRDAGEPSLAGWTVGLDLDGDNSVDRIAVSDANGDYTFVSVGPGSHVVSPTPRLGWRVTSPGEGNYAVDSVSGLDLNDHDFGFFAGSTIQGRMFDDLNANGIHDAGEPGANGVVMELVDAVSGDVVSTVSTFSSDENRDGVIDPVAETGIYWFAGLDIGDYVVRQADSNPWIQTFPSPADYSVQITSGGQLESGRDFGSYRLASVVGRIFVDQNANASFDFDESPLNGWDVQLIDPDTGSLLQTVTTANWDRDSDGTIDPRSETGWYRFTGLVPDAYDVREVLPEGWQRTFPATEGYAVQVVSGEVAQRDFGNRRKVGNAAGGVWSDLNADGIRNAGEPGIPGAIVFLDQNGNERWDVQSHTLTTNHPLTPIPTLQSVESVLTFDATSDRVADINVTLNIDHPFTADIDAYLVSPSGTRVELFTDVGGSRSEDFTNTILDDDAAGSILDGVGPFRGRFRPEGSLLDFRGESPVGDWTLEVTDDGFGFNGALIDWTIEIVTGERFEVTNTFGNYAFIDIPAVDQLIRQVQLEDRPISFPSVRGVHDVTVPVAGTVQDLNFGNAPVGSGGSVRGRVWNDQDGNGLRENDNLPLVDWLVYLDQNGNGLLDPHEARQRTLPNGTFSFIDVIAGDYVLRQELRHAGWVVTVPGSDGHDLAISAGDDIAGRDFGIQEFTLLSEGQPTLQSSSIGQSHASLAVDGNTDGDYLNGSVSATKFDTNAWWQVDLGRVYDVAFMDLWNRDLVGTDRLSDIEVLTSRFPFASNDLDALRDDPFVDHVFVDGVIDRPSRIQIDQLARFVRVQLTGTDYLTIAEAQVFGLSVDNVVPDAFNDALITEVNTPFVESSSVLTANDIDLDGHDLVVDSVGQASFGTVVLQSDGTLRYEPNAGFVGFDSFAYSVTDGHGGIATATVDVEVRYPNIALGKAVKQSSTIVGASASRAVDGGTDGVFTQGSVTATNRDANAWWELDLLGRFDVTHLNIWNRSDAAMERLSDFEVFVSTAPFVSNDIDDVRNQPAVQRHVVSGAAERPTRLSIDRTARFVRIQLTDREYLSLAEVEVFGAPAFNLVPVTEPDLLIVEHGTTFTGPIAMFLENDTDFEGDALSIVSLSQAVHGSIVDNQDGTFTYTPAEGFGITDSFRYTLQDSNGAVVDGTVSVRVLQNLAAGQATRQSSTLIGAVAGRAVDGDADGNFAQGSVTATRRDANAWWEVDLGHVQDIGYIDIFNRTDAATDRLRNVDVFVSDAPFTSPNLTTTRNQPGVQRFQLLGTVGEQARIDVQGTGRFVRVQLTDTNYLSLAEVKVYGLPNLSEGKPVDQSSVILGATADRAVDGNSDGDLLSGGSVTATNRDLNAWWQVDLGEVSDLHLLRVHNRTDAASSRLHDFEVFVSGFPFESEDLDATRQQSQVVRVQVPGIAGDVTDIPLGVRGQFVRIQLTEANYLSLAEVQVFGTPNSNQAPNAISDSATAGQDATEQFDPAVFVANDTDPEGHPLRLTDVQSGPNGIVEFDGTHVLYTPNPGFFGIDSFGYTINDGQGGTSEGTVSVRVFPNIAAGKPTLQSSNFDSSTSASAAVDGDATDTFSATLDDLHAWWQVDLGTLADIHYINVWNREGAAGSALADFEVFVSDRPFLSPLLDSVRVQPGVQRFIVSGEADRPTRVDINSDGRYVRVQLTDRDILAMTELQVIGLPTNTPPVAFSDQLIVTAQTGLEIDAQTLIANDHDAEGDPLTITAITQPIHGVLSVTGDGTWQYTPDPGFLGIDGLTYTVSDDRGGSTTTSVSLRVVENVAINGVASQSSTLIGASADRAIDGVTDGNFFGGSVTATNADLNAWWEVDLSMLNDIAYVEIWNRTDAAMDRLSNFEVFVSAVPFVSSDIDAVRTQPNVNRFAVVGQAGTPTRIDVNRAGQYVRVQLTDQDYLSLAEVRVIGSSSAAPLPQPITVVQETSVDALDTVQRIRRVQARSTDVNHDQILNDGRSLVRIV